MRSRRRSLTLVLGGAASSYAPTPAATWVVSGGSSGGTVEAIAVSGSTAYVGGDFAYMGPETGSFVSLDSTHRRAHARRGRSSAATSTR